MPAKKKIKLKKPFFAISSQLLFYYISTQYIYPLVSAILHINNRKEITLFMKGEKQMHDAQPQKYSLSTDDSRL